MPQQLIFEWARELPPAFENFLPGSNAEVIAHLRALAAGDRDDTSIVIWGAPGSGKSHLLAATIAAAQARRRHAIALDIEHAYAEAIDAIVAGALFAIDDIDTLSPPAQARLFTLYNACRDARAQLLLSAAVPPALAALRDDLRTRVGWGLVLELKPLTDADKPAALAAYANEQGFRLGSEVIDFLLTRGRRDMGALLGEPMRQAFDHLEKRYNDGREWKLHYVSARETYNIIKAAEAGLDGDPGSYRDHVIARPAYAKP